jgi:hypothetical protein
MTLQQEVGRKKEKKEYMSATIDPGIKEAVDEVRGLLPYQISRSQYIQLAIIERVARDKARSSSSGSNKKK